MQRAQVGVVLGWRVGCGCGCRRDAVIVAESNVAAVWLMSARLRVGRAGGEFERDGE